VPRYAIDWSEMAKAEFKGIRSFYRRSIVSAVDDLRFHAETETRNRKRLRLPIEGALARPEPTWEIRVGTFRVIYQVEGQTAYVLGVKIKGRRITGDIL